MAEYDKVIPPGQEGKIVLKVEGGKVHGHFKKSATITSNDPKHPIMTISVKGVIKRYVEVLPADRIYLSGIYGERVEKDVKIISREKGIEFKILGVDSNIDDKVTYKVVPGDSAGHYILKVWKNPKLPVMQTWGTITLRTNSEHVAKKAVQVSVTTKSLILAQPSIVNFGRVKPNAEKESPRIYKKTITVMKLKGKFEIKDITFSADNYSASVETLEIGRKYAVTVKLRPDNIVRTYTDQMIINTDDPLEPKIKVRLLARSL